MQNHDPLSKIILSLTQTYNSPCLEQLESEASLILDQRIRDDIKARIKGLSVAQIEGLLEGLSKLKQPKKLEVKKSK